ncbi:hypothetical protein BK131_19005 [Paenibacillus amylolyticus]|uniref:Uncharacterized protein n=1 Tax=Paenibacillus amylolyticus TaxID=1451 RepID=A0A1R1BQK1_PAEAM|nr:hypothetical protein [Paenibacillus amylolyticus]OMF12098.1 hypothetical protein BK131_19005 [Paenibacillus amylolyticus]
MKDKLSIIIPIISAAISLLVLLFGNNIYDKIFDNKANIILQTNKTNQFIPDDLLNITNDYLINNLKKPIADSLRIIQVKNLGNSSKNLRVEFNVDGVIHDYKVESSEAIKSEMLKNDDSIILNLDRLSLNSTIDVKVWFKDEGKLFNAIYTDDISNEVIKENTDTSYPKIISLTIVALIFLESLIFIMLYFMKKSKNKTKENNKKELVEMVLTELSENFIEDDASDVNDGEFEEPNSSEKDKVKERLKELVKKQKSN